MSIELKSSCPCCPGRMELKKETDLGSLLYKCTLCPYTTIITPLKCRCGSVDFSIFLHPDPRPECDEVHQVYSCKLCKETWVS